jgi:hypothetical protein
MTSTAKESRRQQTLRELLRLSRELDAWYEARTNADSRKQYASQLKAVYGEVRDAAKAIENHIGNISTDVTAPVENVYARCAEDDRRTIWLWRSWNFFREKFDQRDDLRFIKILKAADEVVWSCYKPFFSGADTKRVPAPLPFIGPAYSPMAVTTERGFSQDEIEDKSLLQRYFDTLPIPTLELPVNTDTMPWNLVLVGHETGHFIQRAVQEDFAYIGTLRVAVSQAATAMGASKEDAMKWGGWSQEIFADWYSVLTMGQWALWVLGQYLLTEEHRMLDRQTNYPPPLVRLAFIAAMADACKLPGKAMLTKLGIDPAAGAAGNAEAERDLSYVGTFVRVLTQPLPDGWGELKSRLVFRADEFRTTQTDRKSGEVEEWSLTLLGKKNKEVNKHIRTPRLIAAGAAQACASIMELGDEGDRETAWGNLSAAVWDKVIASAEDSPRAVPKEPVFRKAAGPSLADLLFQADPRKLVI